MKNLIPLFGKRKRKSVSAVEFHHALDIDVLARTLWGEARGEGQAGMTAVAHVVLNRVRIAADKGGYWWGDTVVQVCQKPYQFSCWNKDDPNYGKVLSVDDRDPHFTTAQRIARRALLHLTEDPTGGATHYHAAGITPYWARHEKPLCVIGSHIFYKLVEV